MMQFPLCKFQYDNSYLHPPILRGQLLTKRENLLSHDEQHLLKAEAEQRFLDDGLLDNSSQGLDGPINSWTYS